MGSRIEHMFGLALAPRQHHRPNDLNTGAGSNHVLYPSRKRGAIRGLLPHGPHNVRDVLATHILKQTGSFEQASYAIQDAPDIVAKHYGRFLPENKSALAADILNRVWRED